MNKEDKKVIELRVGRVYEITPDPLPGFKKKARPAIYIGNKIFDKARKYLFIQIGSTKVTHHDVSKLNDKLDILWNQLQSKKYLHLDISKYEYFRVINHPFIKKREYVQIDVKSVVLIKEAYKKRVHDLEDIRLKKAKGYAIQGKFRDAKRQLNLLKHIMPMKHKRLHPGSLVRKWKKAFDSI